MNLCFLLSDDDIIPLKDNINLTEIYLSRISNVTDISIVTIAENCKKLTKIFLSGCSQLTDVSILALAKYCPELEEIGWSGCRCISDIAVLAIGTLRNVRELFLPGNRIITDVSINAISNGCKKLVKLHVSGCNITDDAIRNIAARCHYLEEKK